jgi:hypothetical protein
MGAVTLVASRKLMLTMVLAVIIIIIIINYHYNHAKGPDVTSAPSCPDCS